ncbi:MAG: hypothetical protein AAF404_13905 [Pseudomonadota bacterium]
MSALTNMPQPFFEFIGVAGFIFYMLAYALLQMGKLSGHGYAYTLLNMIAAILVLISLIHQFNLASLLIQVSWVAISIYGLIRLRNDARERRAKQRIRRRPTSVRRRPVSAYM